MKWREVYEIEIKLFFLFCFSDSISNYPSDLQPHKLIQFEDILTISTKEGTNILNAKLRLREILDTHFVAEIEYPLDKWQHDMTEHRKIDKTT